MPAPTPARNVALPRAACLHTSSLPCPHPRPRTRPPRNIYVVDQASRLQSSHTHPLPAWPLAALEAARGAFGPYLPLGTSRSDSPSSSQSTRPD
jgi:hypothetical protein